MPRGHIDCLEDLEFFEELEAWDTGDMLRTIGRMLKGADNCAKCLANAAESLVEKYSQEQRAEPKHVREFAAALQATASAIESYSLIYQWAVQQGRDVGRGTHQDMDALMDNLNIDEMKQLKQWMSRSEQKMRAKAR